MHPPLIEGHRRIQFADEGGRLLPLTMESIGYNPQQEQVSRPDGYHLHHWIETLSGEGILHFGDKSVPLPAGTGMLLLPGVPHRYEALEGKWQTYYLTFGGTSAESILESLEIHFSAFFSWEQEAPLNGMVGRMLERQEAGGDMLGLESSTGIYRFLLTLSKFGQHRSNAPISRNIDKLQPLLNWMESRYGDPDIGLSDLSACLGVSGRHLGNLFLQTFGLSPYAYMVRLRIRKSKEMLIGEPSVTVKTISQRVGFRDVSHFVATFHKQAGVTPEQFRRLH
ncbi:AraC family transcriptional regulator [Paenibacillus stellifer]|uniref:AraC family transcriptional regulator n=1 Tax=Paenibacillus stellifer TaxID=169760 RepID=UPI000A016D75|nr:AraC family transcriptional regulator [Paenibacillus stellifer]